MRNVLFVCSDNAILGPIAEVCLNRAGGDLRGFSAARIPAARLHPMVERLLRRHGHATGALVPKSWEIFALPYAPAPDLLIGLGGRIPTEEPPWSTAPERRHWPLPPYVDLTPTRLSVLHEAIAEAVDSLFDGRAGDQLRIA